jgi:pyridoxamine 5'-phosphate oxidase
MLDRIVQGVWSSLANAANPRATRSPFTMLGVATLGLDGGPQMRTVVLRGIDVNAGALVFYTDARSTKIAEIARDNRVALLGWDDANIQIRLEGTAAISRDDDITKAHWEAARARSLIVYRAPLQPGVPIDAPAQGQVPAHEASGPLDGYAHFCVITVTVQKIDYLDLSPHGHERAVFRRQGEGWQGQWVAP